MTQSDGSTHNVTMSDPQQPPTRLTVSEEFQTGSTTIGLGKLRTRLLDLTARNRLLNFRHSAASSLRVVDVNLDNVFDMLVDGRQLSFMPVPDPPKELARVSGASPANGDEKPIPILAADHASRLGWNTSLDLLSKRGKEQQACLPVLHYPEKFEAISRKIGSAAKAAIEESGTNMLYLTFGFLEWYESEDSTQPRLAPLITLPVALERSATKTKGFQCTIEFSGEDLPTNLSLVEKLKADFGFTVPSVEDGARPSDYFAQLKPILAQKPQWKLRPQITLSLLGFGKLLMYRDLDPNNWPQIAQHDIIRDFFEGSKAEFAEHAPEYLIDEHRPVDAVPPVVLDADSSQHSVLIDAIAGRNLVVEGPPGTGKSQTICNLIAAALNARKNVLFVSEKLAALEVVRRRLDECGLGMFCLELHSHKTKKDNLIRDLEARIKARGSFSSPSDLEKQRTLLDRRKRELTTYATLLNTRLKPSNWTVFEVLWARDRALQLCDATNLLQQGLAVATEYSQADFADAEQFVELFSTHLLSVSKVTGSLRTHPWAWVLRPIGPLESEEIIERLKQFVTTCQDLRARAHAFAAECFLEVEPTIKADLVARDLLSRLPADIKGALDALLVLCRESSTRGELQAFADQLEAAKVAVNGLRRVAKQENVDRLLAPDVGNRLQDALNTARVLGLASQPLSGLSSALVTAQHTESSGRRALSLFENLRTEFALDVPQTTSGLEFLLLFCDALEVAPEAGLHLRNSEMEKDGAARRVLQAAQAAKAIRKERAVLEALLSGPSETSTGKLLSDADILENAKLWQRLFGSAYRAARATYRNIRRDATKLTRRDTASALRRIATQQKAETDFAADPRYKSLLGEQAAGAESEWDAAVPVANWYERVFQLLPDERQDAARVRNVLFSARTERLKQLRTIALARAAERQELYQFGRALPDVCAAVDTEFTHDRQLGEITADIRQAVSGLERAVGVFTSSELPPELTVTELESVIVAIADVDRKRAAVAANESARALLGADSAAVLADEETLATSLGYAARICAAVPEATANWILAADSGRRVGRLRGLLEELQASAHALSECCHALDAVAGSDWTERATRSLVDCDEPLSIALRGELHLPDWTHFVRLRAEAEQRNLSKLIDFLDREALTASELVPAFRFLCYNALARAAFAEHRELSGLSGVSQDEMRRQFMNADKASISLFRQHLASEVDSRTLPWGNGSGPIGTWTDLALIRHEITKQKRHIPIRQLVRKAGRALQAMKPCFMMGPLSVAQYLPPGKLSFDLVVMDEASQLKPEDAMGAIARGGQIVVVGDPKQLPPTSFFQRVADEDVDDPERTVAEEGESILDVASTTYQPARRLRWHYRSRHHSLIAFSNREFYQGDLVVFPSAYHEDPHLGIRFHRIAEGVFDSRRNSREAARVVDAVLAHMEARPDESLGVVALNFEQMEVIEEMLDRRLRMEPAALAFQEKMSEQGEPFFVKNLENVQGDERDVIFISTTYGPDPAGNQYQRFGPINGPNGHRRLNVLFTRAKKRVELFCSLDIDRIAVSDSSPWGVRALKQYLSYARSGILEGASEHADRPTNDFEESVGAILRQHGFQVVHEVGVAGFFIDLGVKHPGKPGTFILGIECDGATYHSARSARDRDRLRQEILENLGWKIHRIWSTDWFRNRSGEIERLLTRIKKLVEADPEYRRLKEREQREEQLREALRNLRLEIESACHGIAQDECLLGPEMLSEFLGKRPKTKESFLNQIPGSLRSRLAPGQVGTYLPRVLEIFNRYGN